MSTAVVIGGCVVIVAALVAAVIAFAEYLHYRANTKPLSMSLDQVKVAELRRIVSEIMKAEMDRYIDAKGGYR